MKRVVFILLLLASLAAAIDVSPKMIGSVVVDAHLTWTVDLAGQTASELQLKSYAFFGNAQQSQQVISSSAYSSQPDALGNPVIVFNLDTSAAVNSVDFQARVSADYAKGFEAAPDASQYLGESKYVLMTPEIRSKATEVAGSGSGLEKATRLAEWVHNSLQYEGLGFFRDNLLTSQEAFEQRKGKCSEYSHLFIAMLRSQGIPSRFVAGFVYSGDEWAPHAWTEAAIDGKWIPFDATYGEGIILDATHLKFAHAVDQGDVREEITGKGYSLDLSSAKISRGAQLSFVSKTNFSGLVLVTVSAPSEALGEGSLATVSARVRATRDMAVPLSLTVPTTPVEMKVVDEKDRLVFMRAGEEREINWTVIVPGSLAENYVYTFPISVLSLGVEAKSNLTAKKGGAVSSLTGLEISELSYFTSGDSLKIVSELRNKGSESISGATVYATLFNDTKQQAFSLAAGEKKRFEFGFPLPGEGKYEGEIKAVFGTNSLSQKFVLTFSRQPTAQPSASASASASPSEAIPSSLGGVDVKMLAGFGVAIILILLAVILLVRRGRHYSDF